MSLAPAKPTFHAAIVAPVASRSVAEGHATHCGSRCGERATTPARDSRPSRERSVTSPSAMDAERPVPASISAGSTTRASLVVAPTTRRTGPSRSSQPLLRSSGAVESSGGGPASLAVSFAGVLDVRSQATAAKVNTSPIVPGSTTLEIPRRFRMGLICAAANRGQCPATTRSDVCEARARRAFYVESSPSSPEFRWPTLPTRPRRSPPPAPTAS